MLYVIYLSIVVLSIIILSPRIHTGFICTVGMSIMGLGLLGLALQESELGSLQYGVTGQLTAIKIGAIVSVAGLVFNLFKPVKRKNHLPEISSKDQRQVSGGTSESGGN